MKFGTVLHYPSSPERTLMFIAPDDPDQPPWTPKETFTALILTSEYEDEPGEVQSKWVMKPRIDWEVIDEES
jgi:hypothetical protein